MQALLLEQQDGKNSRIGKDSGRKLPAGGRCHG